MAWKYRDLDICISDSSGSTELNEGKKEIVCEFYAVADTERKNRLDKLDFTVGVKDFNDAVAVVFPYIFEYVRERYAELLAAAQRPLDDVLDAATQRALHGWTFNEDCMDGFEEDLKSSLYDEL